MSKNELADFFLSTTRSLSEEYERIQKRAIEDPGTAGDQGEENWATILKAWLPSNYHVVTKGRILFASGVATPQVDIIVLQPEYPTFLLDKKLYLSGGVLAAFECKLTLKANDIKKTIKNCVFIKENEDRRFGSPLKELNTHILYGLLAHSHTWKRSSSKPYDNISKLLYENDLKFVKHPREMLDLLCVSDLSTWISSINTFMGPAYTDRYYELKMHERYGDEGYASSSYSGAIIDKAKYTYTPIGDALLKIMSKLSTMDSRLERLTHFYQKSELQIMSGGYQRVWNSSIYSGEIREMVVKGKANNKKINEEWSMVFR